MGSPEEIVRNARPNARLRRVRWPEDLATVRGLFQEYRQWIADHKDSSNDAEPRTTAGLAILDQLVRELPGAYEPPHGDVLLWFENDEIVVCGALREIEPGVGEIKRLHVSPEYRGREFGTVFAQALVDRARELGFDRVRADVLSTMVDARVFYEAMGFRPIPAFWPHPVAGALFFERALVD